MAMKTSSPWWVSLLFGVGLLLLFAGQHVLSHIALMHTTLTWAGLLLVVGATALRGFAFTRADGRARQVEQIMLVCHAIALVALVVYYLTTDGGAKHLGISDPKSLAKWRTVAEVGWSILIGLSIIPLFMVEISLGTVGRDNFARPEGGAAVELVRVREMVSSGLTIALAAAFLMVTCNVAEQKDIRKDVSYFKTSSPGSATVNMTKSLNDTLTVYLFFPEVNEVADEVESYFKELQRETGDKIVIEREDRLVAPQLTKDLKVNADGTIVLKKGDKDEKFTIDTDIAKARRTKEGSLRELDETVQKSLMKVIRAKRVAYFSVGHGELNDPTSAGPLDNPDPLAKSTLMKQLMSLLNYEVKDFDGFGKPVPDDCSILFVLEPKKALMPEELASIDDYLGQGGSLLIALDPSGEAGLGKLEGRLGVKFNPQVLADDKEFMVRRHNDSDHRLILTNQFSSHASVTTLSRGGVHSGILMIEAGYLEDADFTVKGDKPKKTYVIHSMGSTFADLNHNDAFDKDSEKRDRYNLVAAIEDPNAKPAKKKEGGPDQGMRVMVFADGEVFSDILLRQVPLIQGLVVDAVKWLGGEEEFAGETVSEKDIYMEQTKSQDVVLYYGSIIGAPLVVLGLGLTGVFWRRRRVQGRRS